MAMGTRGVRPMKLSDCGCGTVLAGVGLLLRGGRQQRTVKQDPVPWEDMHYDTKWLRGVSDTLSNCSTTALTDSSDDEISLITDSPKSVNAFPSEATIIFDWDDTLSATSHIRKVLGDTKCAAEASAELQAKLAKHGACVKAALISARATAHVSIVTLSARPWVTQSAERYFPGMGIAALLDELDITVYYAAEHATAASVASLEHFAALKQSAMSRCLAGTTSRNVISIGDSIIEQQALKRLVYQWGLSEPEKQTPLCKIVKFMDGPSLDELTDQLVFLEPWLSAMVTQQNHFQLSINNTADLCTSALDFVKLLPSASPSES